MKDGLSSMMKQAEKMQADMKKVQKEISRIEVNGQSGGGLVSIIMTGRHEVKKVDIDKTLFEEDSDMIGDLLAAAVNDAVRKIQKNTQERMSRMTVDMGLPPGIKWPF